MRRKLLEELNANLSYLVLFCCFSLIVVLISYIFEWKTGIAPAICSAIYLHFLMTLVMIVKRAHALFQKEYRDSEPS